MVQVKEHGFLEYLAQNCKFVSSILASVLYPRARKTLVPVCSTDKNE